MSPSSILEKICRQCMFTLKMNLTKVFHHNLNSIEPSIQFTLEIKSSSQLAFLDILKTQKPDKCIHTTIYKKTMNTHKIP